MNSFKMNILSYFKKLFLVFFLITLSGCTHKIDITPNNDKIINLGYTIEKRLQRRILY